MVTSSCMRALHDFLLCMHVYLSHSSFPSSCIFLLCALFSKISLYSKMGLRPTTSMHRLKASWNTLVLLMIERTTHWDVTISMNFRSIICGKGPKSILLQGKELECTQWHWITNKLAKEWPLEVSMQWDQLDFPWNFEPPWNG
jgi:hypothetical protein